MNKTPKAYEKMLAKWITMLLLLMLLPLREVQAQGCECVGCSGVIPLSSTTSYTLNISGSTNNDLNNPGQGICGIYLDFEHEFIYAMGVTLTSPSGQTVTLMGPPNNGGASSFITTGATWDVGFLPCGDSVDPDVGLSGVQFPDIWFNNNEWVFGLPYDGTYHPYSGCLEDINGSVNGDWTITIDNISANYVGQFNGFSIVFCDDSGLGCVSCEPDAGSLFFVPDFDVCEGDVSTTVNFDPTYSGTPPSPDYSYTYIVSSNNVIQEYNDLSDFSTLTSGTYEVCGLSYLTTDAPSIPMPNGVMSVADLNNQIATTGIFCGEISNDCFTVTVVTPPSTVVVNAVICEGETYMIGGNSFATTGTHFANVTTGMACDSMYQLNLTVNDTNIVMLDEYICLGDTFFIENNFYTTTGLYLDTLTNVAGCDSIIDLKLTTLDPQINIAAVDELNCQVVEVDLDGSGSTSSSNVSYLWTTSNGNISGNSNNAITQVDTPGEYFLTITQSEGNTSCTVVDSVEVFQNITPSVSEAGMDSVLNCQVMSIVLDGTASSSGTEFQYQWTTPTGGTIQNPTTTSPTIDAAGTYYLEVTNTNSNCTAIDSVIIVDNSTLPNANAGMDMEINCTNLTVQLDGTGSSQGSEFQYQWTASPGVIVSGTNNLNPEVSAEGSYELLVTNTNNFCTSTATVQVTIDTLPPIADAGSTVELNCNFPTAVLDGSNSSQGGPYTYQWTAVSGGPIFSNPNSLFPTVNTEGIYELVVTNTQNNCSASSQVIVNQDFDSPISNAGTSQTITCNTLIVELDGTGSSMGSTFNYQWNVVGTGSIFSGATTLTPEIDAAGMYQLMVTNTDNGCTELSQVVEVFSDNNLPTAVVGNDGEVNCNNTFTILDGTGSSVGSDFIYVWTASNGGNILSNDSTLMPTVNGQGDYELVVTDTTNGCTANDIAMVTVDTIPPIANAGIDTIINCNNPTIFLLGNGSSTGVDISYQWTTSDGSFIGNSNAISVEIDSAGTYELTVINNQTGCTATDEVIVLENFESSNADAGSDGFLNCGVSSIMLDGTNSSQGQQYIYNWTTVVGGNIISGENTLTPLVNAAGTYELLVTNTESGCTDSDQVIVTADTNVPIADPGNDTTMICGQSSIILNGNNSSVGIDIVYEWTTFLGNIVSGNNSLTPEIDAAGIYLLIVTDTINGCSSQGSVIVSVDTIPPIAAAGNDTTIICLSSSLTLNSNNTSTGTGISYLWTTPNGNIISDPTSLSPEVDSAGIYYLDVFNSSNNCSAIDSVLVTMDTIAPIANAGLDTMLDCNIPSVWLGTNSFIGNAFNYEWSTVGGNFLTNENLDSVLVDSAGTYILTITNNNNSCSTTDEVIVTQQAILPIADAGNADVIPCNPNQLILDGSASSVGSDFQYLWTTGSGSIISGETTLTPLVDSAGIYLLTVTNIITGCSSSDAIIVTNEICNLIAEAGTTASIGCNASTITLDGTGSSVGINITYLWTTQNGTIISSETTLMPTVGQAGTYVLTVVDTLLGPSAQDSVIVTTSSSNLPTVVTSANGTLSCQDTTVIVSGIGSSMGTEYLNSWSTNNGNIVAIIGGINALVNQPGWYYLEITNTITGCSSIDSVEVLQDTSLPIADAGIDTVLNCYNNVITLDGTNSSMGNNLVYSWNTVDGNILLGDSTLTPLIDSIGTYVLTVLDTTNNCSTTSDVEVTEDFTIPFSDAGMNQELNCTDTILILDGSNSSNGIEYSYEWETILGNILFGENTTQPTINFEGQYDLIVIDNSNGCRDTSSVIISSDFTSPIAVANVDAMIDCGVVSILLEGTGSTTADVQYLWTTQNGNIINGAQNLSVEVTSGGTYTLSVQSDLNGCIAVDSTLVTQPNCMPQVVIAIPDTITCLQTQVMLDGSASSNWATLDYQWTTGNGTIIGTTNSPIITAGSAGDYVLTITDLLTNLSSSTSVTVESINALPNANAGLPDTLNCNVSILQLDGTGSSIGTEYTYQWNTIGGNIINDPTTLNPTIDSAGIYELVVTNTISNCTASAQVVIEMDTIVPTVNAGLDMNLTCDNPILILDGSASSSGSEFSILWNTNFGNFLMGNTTLQPQVDGVGNYELTITNNVNGCIANDNVEVTVDTIAPDVNITLPQELNCTVTSFNIDASNSSTGTEYSYLWTTTSGNIVSGNTSLSPEIDEPGTYIFSIENNNTGCVNEDSIIVNEDIINPIANAGLQMELNCIDTILMLDGSSSSLGIEFQYNWTTALGNIISGENTISPNIDLPGMYQLEVLNYNNTCTSVAIVEITQNITNPSIAIEPTNPLNCQVQTIDLDASNSSTGMSFNYSWNTIDGNFISGQNSLTPTIDEGGIYELQITDSQNGCVSLASITVVQDTIVPTTDAGLGMTLTCIDTVFILNGNNSSIGNEYQYLWTTATGNIVSGNTDLTPMIDEPGIYELEILNANNQCTSSDFVEIEEDIQAPQPMIDAIGGLVIDCNVSSIVFDGNGSLPIGQLTFEWTTINGNFLSGENTPSPEINQSGNYFVVLTNTKNGCTSSTNIDVTEDFEQPIINVVTPDVLTCVDTVITLSGQGSSIGNDFQYLWTTTNGNIISGQTNVESFVDESGEYNFQVTDLNNGCAIDTSIFIMENVVYPLADAGVNYEFDCVNPSLQLSGTASLGNEFVYEWNTNNGNILLGSNTLTPTVNENGTYTLAVTNLINGCVSTSDAIVTEDMDVPEFAFFEITSPLCYGEYNGSISLENVVGGEPPYEFSFNNSGNYSPQSDFNNLGAGNYQIGIVDASGCAWDTILSIQDPDPVEVELGENIYIELGEEVSIEALTNISIDDLESVVWTASDSIPCADCLEQEVAPLETSGYAVTLTSVNGCVTQDDILVFVNNERNVFIPNAFSPNNDGINDIFMIYGGVGVEKVETLQIFDRWGEMVFQRNNFDPNDESVGWDGRFNNQQLNSAVFVFFAKIKYINGETEVMKGDVFLKGF